MKLVFLMLCSFLFISCDIFAPRTPDEPEAARGDFRPPTSADIVIENFTSSIRERNPQHYVQNFVDTSFSHRRYEFIPTSDAVQFYGLGLFSDWSVREERSYFENLLSKTPSHAEMSVTFTNSDFETITSDSAVYRAHYSFTVHHTDEGFPYTQFQGTLQFFLSTDNNNNWVIHKWRDIKFGEEHSWSMLKGKFVN